MMMDQSDEQFKRQIQYILEQLNSNVEDEEGKDGKSINANEGDDDDNDEEEEEDDEEYDEEEDMFDAEDEEFNDIIDE